MDGGFCSEPHFYFSEKCWAFPGGLWLKLCLPVQGTRVRSLVQSSPRAVGQPSTLLLMKPRHSRARAVPQEKPPQSEPRAARLGSSPRSPQLERARVGSGRDSVQPEVIMNMFLKMHRHIIHLQVLGLASSERFGKKDDFGGFCSVFFHLCNIGNLRVALGDVLFGEGECLFTPGGSPGGAGGKERFWSCRRHERCGLHPWVGEIPWRRAWQPTPGFLPGESHGQRSLVGCSPWGRTESDMTAIEHASHALSPVFLNRSHVCVPNSIHY